LEKALDAARAEIKKLKAKRVEAEDDNRITSWHIDRRAYTATPFDKRGRPGATLDARELFEMYYYETSND